MRRGLFDETLLRHLLYQALDGSDNIVLVLEQSGDDPTELIVVATNDAFCRTSGFIQAELIGRPFFSLAAPDANPATCTAIGRSARERRSYRSELLCNRRAGAPFWLGLHLMPAGEDRTPYFVVLGRDISETLRDRQQHAAIQGLLAKVFVSVQAAVAVADESGAILMTNPAIDRLLGYPAGGLIGKLGMDLVGPEARASVLAARQRQLEDGQTYTMEIPILRADGSQVRVEFASTIADREDLKRFRILTLFPLASPGTAASVSVHIAGKIRLIGLDEVRTALGSRWAAAASRVMASAEHVIRARCGPRDTWSRTTDGGFLICFGDVTEDEAALGATTIARDIRTRLIGEGETPSTAYVSAITASVDLPDQPGRSPDMLAVAIGERLNARLAEIEAWSREVLRKVVRTATCELTAVRSHQVGEIVGYFAALPSALENGVQRALAALPARESEAFDLDRLMLAIVAGQLVAGLATGSTLPIMVPVDFEVFLDRHRTERYVAACQELDERLRPRLILVLTQLPPGVPKGRVLECATRLRPFCRTVGFQVETMELHSVEFSALGASIVVVQERDLNAWDAKDLAKLDRLINLVRAHRGRVLVRQISSCENATRLLKLGVDLVALAQDNGQPAGRGWPARGRP